jgi:UDP-N-acetylmuramyl pentapeptide synthase
MLKDYLKQAVVWIITLEAKLVLKKYQPKIVAVTGNVGKTSTKDAIFSVLSESFSARKSPKSFNSEIGLPLTILDMYNGWSNPFKWIRIFLQGLALLLLPNHYPKWLVLEVGADRPGDIKKISEWLFPDVAVFTKMSRVPVHIEFFESPEKLLQEKLFLAKSLNPHGVIVYNYDDEDIKEAIKSFSQTKISFGFGEGAQISASNYKVIYQTKNKVKQPAGLSFKLNFQGNVMPVSIKGTLGRHQIYPALAAIASAAALGINLVKSGEGINNFITPPGRMRILKGVKSSVVIDDSYNSSPVALAEAVSVLESLNVSGRKIAVLGDMLELGKFSIEEHKKAGREVGRFVDFLITVGVRARYIAEAAEEAGFLKDRIFVFDDSRLAGKHAELLLKENDVVLVKGSQSMRMEKAVEEIMAEPLRKEELLARQDKKWININ